MSSDDRSAFDEVLRRADEIAERLAAELELPEGLEVVFDRSPLLEAAEGED